MRRPRLTRNRASEQDRAVQHVHRNFTKLSPRVVRYRLDHVLEYEERNVFASNAEALVAADDSPEAA
jgi:hypothetical protein